MRMWGIAPKKLCRQHLLGEHAEMHMFVGCIKKGISINGYVDGGLVEVQKIKPRHDLLASEMKRRGMHHCSPLFLRTKMRAGKLNVRANIKDLAKRCRECRKLL